ncbi:hypothetical protein F5B20DRAFT_319200 [Whalleya microplaca]|nr:hypothetical protein F5B20DRAFT_319200 [Whalleya microplaca]
MLLFYFLSSFFSTCLSAKECCQSAQHPHTPFPVLGANQWSSSPLHPLPGDRASRMFSCIYRALRDTLFVYHDRAVTNFYGGRSDIRYESHSWHMLRDANV